MSKLRSPKIRWVLEMCPKCPKNGKPVGIPGSNTWRYCTCTIFLAIIFLGIFPYIGLTNVDFMWISCGFRPALGTSHDVAMTFFQLRSRDRDDRPGRDRRDRPSAVGSDEFIRDPSSEWSGTSTLWLPLVMTNSSPWYRLPIAIEIDGLPFLIAWRFSMAMLVITRWYPMNMITISPIHKYIMDHCGNHNQ